MFTAADTAGALRGSPYAQRALGALRFEGSLTLSELADRTGLSRPTLSTAVDELIAKGWVTALEPANESRSAGRPPRRFRFRREAALVVGVDVGLHKVLAIVTDLSENVICEHQISLPPAMTAADRVDAVANTVVTALELTGTAAPPLAIAVGAPGVIDQTGRILRCPPIPEWDGIDLGNKLSQRIGCPAFVENDVMAAAWGEHWRGAARDTEDFVYLLAGHRVSSAAVINGRLHRGFTGAAGMVGELPDLRWSEAPARLTSAMPGHETAQAVFSAANDGDAVAIEAVHHFVEDLAHGLAAVALAIDPELVVVGGGVSLAGPTVVSTLRTLLTERAHLVSPRVENSQLGDHATALGACRVALDKVEQSLMA